MTKPEPLTAEAEARLRAHLIEWPDFVAQRLLATLDRERGDPRNAKLVHDTGYQSGFEAGVAAERAKVAGLVERFAAMKMAAVFPDGRPDRTGYAAGWNDALDEVLPALRAALSAEEPK